MVLPINLELENTISRLREGRIMVVGDVAIDEMTYGGTARLSREAPVLILNHHHTDILLGAAGNAAHNIAKLGAKRTVLIAVTGQDYHCSLLHEAMERDGVDTAGLIADADRPTTTKTRISGMVNQSITQQIVRIDRESRDPLPANIENKLLDQMTRIAKEGCDAVLLSDYALGVVSESVIGHCRALAKQYNLFWVVDSQQNLCLFEGADVVTPNLPEAEQTVGFEIQTPEALLRAGEWILNTSKVKNALITRSSDGMMLFESASAPDKEMKYTDIPVFNRSDVFDVTGAGDTVVGSLTLALATGASLLEAAVLGNVAASIVVRRFGAATTTPEELRQTLSELPEALMQQINTRQLISSSHT